MATIHHKTAPSSHIWATVMLYHMYLAHASRCLRFGVKQTPPFTMSGTYDAEAALAIELTAPYTGFAMQYWAEMIVPAAVQEVASIIEARDDDEIALPLDDEINFSCLNITEYPTTVEMLRGAGLGEVDISHTAITMTSSRESTFNLDFSHSWFVSGYRVLAREQTDLLSVSLALFSTLGQAVGLFVGVIVVCAIAGGLILVPLEEMFPGPVKAWPEHGSTWVKFETAMYIALWALFGQYAVEPQGMLVKPAILIFKILGPLLTIVVTALVTVYMLQEAPVSRIEGFGDLDGKTVNVPVGSTAEAYVRRYGQGLDIEGYDTVPDALDAFAGGAGDAVVYDFPILQYFVTQTSGGGGAYGVVGPVFEEQKYGIAVGPTAPSWLRETINRAILKTWKTEEYRRMEEQWFGGNLVPQVSRNANGQLLVVMLCSLALLGLALVVRMIWWVQWWICGEQAKDHADDTDDDMHRTRTHLGRVVDEQEGFGFALPPPATTRATWELMWAISDYLRRWQPHPVKKHDDDIEIEGQPVLDDGDGKKQEARPGKKTPGHGRVHRRARSHRIKVKVHPSMSMAMEEGHGQAGDSTRSMHALGRGVERKQAKDTSHGKSRGAGLSRLPSRGTFGTEASRSGSRSAWGASGHDAGSGWNTASGHELDEMFGGRHAGPVPAPGPFAMTRQEDEELRRATTRFVVRDTTASLAEDEGAAPTTVARGSHLSMARAGSKWSNGHGTRE